MVLDQRMNVQRLISFVGDVSNIDLADQLEYSAYDDIFGLFKHLPILNGTYIAHQSLQSQI